MPITGTKTKTKTTRSPLSPWLLDTAVVVLVFVVFWPIVRFFFAQDDFVFLEHATQGFHAAVGDFFAHKPGQFRPLTKGLYFLLAKPVFGLHPTPYHVVSILLHALNAVLVGALFRRMGISALASRLTAALFAFNVAFLETVAWISCVQQLVGCMAFLATLILGIDALETKSRGRAFASTAAFVLALASYEQVLAAPFLLLLWCATRHGVRAAWAATRAWLWVQFAVLAVYSVFMLGWKGIPESGPYAMSVGANVITNLRTYTHLLYAVWFVFPAYTLPAGLAISHVVLVALVVLLLIWRRVREVAFGLVAFAVLLLPVMFQSEHTHSFHVYVPGIATWYLLALAMDEGRKLLPRRLDSAAIPVAVAIAAVCFVGSVVAVRRNVTAEISASVTLPRSFVFRRAVLAERMWHDIRAKTTGKSSRLILAYRHPEYAPNWRNVVSAMGQGSAVRLALDRPDLDVVFVPPADAPAPDDSMEVLFYNEFGRCYTMDEVERALRQAK